MLRKHCNRLPKPTEALLIPILIGCVLWQLSCLGAPTAPGSPAATAVSGSQINLSWTAATDNVGVTGYLVERQGGGVASFTQVGTTTGTTFNDTGLTSNTSYSYRVRATDAAGNLSVYSNVATATTLNAPSGLVAAYAFNEGSGTVLTDVSGNGNNGTIAAATWTTAGKYGNALSFSGTSARVTINDAASLHLTTAMTLEAWVNPTTVSSAWRDVIYKGNDNYFLMGSTTSSGRPALGGTFGGANANLYGTMALGLNTWTHLAGTYNGATLNLYVNGVLVASQAKAGNLTVSTNPLQIGGDNIFGQTFQGLIDEVRVYNRALSTAEITTDMNTPVGGSPPPQPTISDIGDQLTTTNTPTVAIPFTIADADTPVGNLTLRGASSNTNLVTTNNIVFGGSGASRTVTVTPAADQTGNTTITVTVSDGTDSASDTFVLTVGASSLGLVAAYGFEEGLGTTARDVSGNGNQGAIIGPTWTTAGKYGNALTFNGVNGWVLVNDAPSLQLTNGMTLEAWVYPFSLPPVGCTELHCSWMDVVMKDSDRYYLLASSNNSQKPEVGGIFVTGKHIIYAPSSLATNTWTHLAVTYDSTMIRLYVNGSLVASAPETALITTSTNPLFIGADQTMGQYFNGRIDEVRVYNRGLSAAEVTTDMNTPVGVIKQTPGVSISSISRFQDGSIRISGTGDTNIVYTVQASDNLTEWQPIGTVATGATGVFQFDDLGATNLAFRFYRIALP